MKRVHAFIAGLLALSASLAGCKDDQMHLHGRMTRMEHEGQTCWIFVDDNHNSYEVITPSAQVLRDGLQMSIRAIESDRKTLCQFPTVIDILEFRPDFSKDM